MRVRACVSGRTALHTAVASHDPVGRGVKSLATTRLLLENGADPKVKEKKCGDTALHIAASLNCDPVLLKVRNPAYLGFDCFVRGGIYRTFIAAFHRPIKWQCANPRVNVSLVDARWIPGKSPASWMKRDKVE